MPSSWDWDDISPIEYSMTQEQFRAARERYRMGAEADPRAFSRGWLPTEIPVRTSPDISGILEKFNDVFSYGIREVVITKEVFHSLISSQSRYITRGPSGLSADHIFINTPHGRMKIIKEGSHPFSNIDFSKYMEDVK